MSHRWLELAESVYVGTVLIIMYKFAAPTIYKCRVASAALFDAMTAWATQI